MNTLSTALKRLDQAVAALDVAADGYVAACVSGGSEDLSHLQKDLEDLQKQHQALRRQAQATITGLDENLQLLTEVLHP